MSDPNNNQEEQQPVISFTEINSNLYIPLKDGEKFYVEFDTTSRSGVIESYNNLIIYLTLITDSSTSIKDIESQVEENFGDGDYKSSILKNTNVGIYKIYKVKNKVSAEIKSKRNKDILYSEIKAKKKYRVKLVLDYLWKRENNHGYTWNIHKIKEI